MDAIERYNLAWAALGVLCSAIDEVATAQRGHEVREADLTAYAHASAVADQALDELLTTPPTTIEGFWAAMRHIAGLDDDYLSEIARPSLMTLLRSPLLSVEQ